MLVIKSNCVRFTEVEIVPQNGHAEKLATGAENNRDIKRRYQNIIDSLEKMFLF